MIENKAYKFRIYPNKEQEILFNKTFGCARKIYNYMLGERIEIYNQFKDDEDKKDKLKNYKYKTEKQLKEEFEFLKEVDSIALQQARVDLDNAYNRFFDKGKNRGFKLKERILKKLDKKTLNREVRNTDLENHPQFKKRKDKQSYRSINVNNNIQIFFDIKTIKIPKLGYIKFSDNRIFNEKIRSLTVSKNCNNKYFISMLVEFENNVEAIIPNSNSKCIGLDYDSKNLFTDNNGNIANYPRFYRNSQKKLKLQQRKLKNKNKESKNYEKQNRRINSVYGKIRNSRNDFLQKLSTQITNEYDIIGVETLNLQGIARSLNLAKSTYDNGFGMFLNMLEYKCRWKGKHLIFADKRYASSKTCNVCGWKNTELQLSDREWSCPQCKTHHHRDINAGINLVNFAKAKLNITVGTTESNAPEDMVLVREAVGESPVL